MGVNDSRLDRLERIRAEKAGRRQKLKEDRKKQRKQQLNERKRYQGQLRCPQPLDKDDWTQLPEPVPAPKALPPIVEPSEVRLLKRFGLQALAVGFLKTK